MREQTLFDVVVVGAGPAGLIAGLCCAERNLRTAVVGPRSNPRDGRTAALLCGSVNLLKRLDIWDEIAPVSEPVRCIRLVDSTGALLRAPEVLFEASEIGLEAFGYNVPNALLTSALEGAAAKRLSRLINGGITKFNLRGEAASLANSEGAAIDARLIVAADGGASPSRSAAGIAVSGWAYQQVAIVASFAHSRPHLGVSTELHRPTGPLTVVPCPGNTSSLVWVETPAEGARLAGLNESDFGLALAPHLNGLLGTLSGFTPRGVFPLRGQTAATLGRNRVALVGEAAHMMPPIGAQGLNLSFRDAATLAQVAGEAAGKGQDIGSAEVLETYASLRKADVSSRVFAVDLLNRSLLSSIPGVHLARGLGLFALAASAGLRARVMREGVMPAAASPELMRAFPQAAKRAFGQSERPLDGSAAQRA